MAKPTFVFKHRMINTELGPRPFTDILVRYRERRLASRFHGHWSAVEVQAWACHNYSEAFLGGKT